MAGRLNTKLIAIIAAATIGVGVVAGGAVWYNGKKDPTPYIEAGDQFVAQGDWASAVKEYRKALNKKRGQSRVDVMIKFINAMDQAPVTTNEDANNTLRLMVTWSAETLRRQPRNEEAFAQFIALQERIAKDLGALWAWNMMQEKCDEILTEFSDYAPARKYRGIAQVNRMEPLDLSPEIRESIREDLDAALAAEPNDVQLNVFSARWYVIQATYYDRPGRDHTKSGDFRLEARRILNQLIEKHPDDFEALESYARMLLVLRQGEELERRREAAARGTLKDGALEESDESKAELARIQEIVQRMENQALEDASDASRVLSVQALLRFVDKEIVTYEGDLKLPRGIVRAIAVLENAVKLQPQALAYRLELGTIYTAINHRDKALEQFRQGQAVAVNAPPLRTLRETRSYNLIRANYADQLLGTYATFEAQADRDALLKEVLAIVTDLEKNASDLAGWPQYLRGKSLLLQGKVHEAVKSIDVAIEQMAYGQTPRVRIEALSMSASLHKRLGRLGTAAARYEQLAQLNPSNNVFLHALASVYIQGKQVEKARGVLYNLLDSDPDDIKARLMWGQVHALNNEFDKAVEEFTKVTTAEKATDAEKQQAELSIIELLANHAQRDKALAKSVEMFNADPKNPSLLRAVLVLAENEEQQQAFITQSETAGMDPKIIASARANLAGRGEQEKMAREQIGNMEDDLKRYLSLHRLETQLGNADAARAALMQAAAADAKNGTVIEGLFDYAVEEENWDKAKELIERARVNNIDGANGLFLVGRLDLAQGRTQRAVASYLQALDARPNYPDGWRQLGDVQLAANELTAANDAYRKCIEQDPTNVNALRGMARIQHARGKYQDALDTLKQVKRLSVNNMPALMQYLNYEQQYGDKQEALRQREDLARRAPKLSLNRRQLAMLLSTMKDRRADGLIEIEQLIADEGSTIVNVDTRARILVTMERADEARKYYADHVEGLGDKESLIDRAGLGRFLWGLGDIDAAVEQYKLAMAIEDPKKRPATRELAGLMASHNEVDRAISLYEVIWNGNKEDHSVGYELARLTVNSGKVDEGEKILNELPQDSQSSVTVLILRSQIASRREKHTEALSIIEKEIERNPSSAALYYQRAVCRLVEKGTGVSGSVAAAIEGDLQRALTLNPDFTDARRRLAMYLQSQERLNDAGTQWRILVDRNPQSVVDRISLARLLFQTDQMLLLKPLLDECRGLFPRASMWPRMQGQVATREGNPAVAIARFREAFDLTPDATNLTSLVEVALNRRQADDALTLLNGHADIVARNLTLMSMKGRALAIKRDMDAALSTFREAIQLCSNYNHLQAVSSQMIASLGTVKTLETLKTEKDADQAVWVQLVLAGLEQRNNDLEASATRLKRLDGQTTADDPYRILIDRQLSLALHFSEEYEAAVDVYKRVLLKTPNDVNSINNLAYLLANELNRVQEAVPYAERAKQLAKGDPNVLDTVGWVQFKAGRYGDAKNTLEMSLGLSPSVDTYYHLGEVLAKLGEENEAYLVEARSKLNEAIKRADEAGRDDVVELASKRLKELGGE